LLPAAQPMRRAALIAVVLIAAESHTKAVFTEAESPTEAETIAAAAGTPALQPDRCGRRCGCRCCGRRLVLRHHGGYDYGGYYGGGYANRSHLTRLPTLFPR